MQTIELSRGRVTLAFEAGLRVAQQRETLAVLYGAVAGVAPVTAADCSWEAAEGAPVTVAITLPAPVCGLGECQGLPFWFSRVRPRRLWTTDWAEPPVADLGLCVQDGVLFSGAGVAVIPRSDGLTIEISTEGDTATYTLTGMTRLAVTVLDGPDLRAVQTAFVRQAGWPAEVPPLLEAPVIYTTWAQYKMRVDAAAVRDLAGQITAQGFPVGVIEIDDRWQAAYGDLT